MEAIDESFQGVNIKFFNRLYVGLLDWIGYIGTLTEKQATNKLYAELNVTLMRAQARMMVTRMAVPDPNEPITEG